MSDKIVAISDLHLGQSGADGYGQFSLLSSRAPENRVQTFIRSVRAFAAGDPVTLLIVGDFLDLSLAYAEDAFTDLRELLAAFSGAVHLDEIVCVVGNHDHHLWSLHSEDKRLLAPLRDGLVPSSHEGRGFKAMYQVTDVRGESFDLLQPLVDQTLGSAAPRITIAYPSYVRALGSSGTQLYATHGHLFGGFYAELSDLLKSKLDGLPHSRVAATVNQPIIEFTYWLLGETGEGIGADGLVEEIYTDLQRGTLSRVRSLVAKIVAQLLPRGALWRLLGRLERRFLVEAVMLELKKALLTPQAATNAAVARHADLETTRAGLRTWLEAINWPKQQSTIALYGHTHVWDDYAIPGTGVHSWNLGTWLVEPNHPRPRSGFLTVQEDVARWIDV